MDKDLIYDYLVVNTDYANIEITDVVLDGSVFIVQFYYETFCKEPRYIIKLIDLLNFIYNKK